MLSKFLQEAKTTRGFLFSLSRLGPKRSPCLIQHPRKYSMSRDLRLIFPTLDKRSATNYSSESVQSQPHASANRCASQSLRLLFNAAGLYPAYAAYSPAALLTSLQFQMLLRIFDLPSSDGIVTLSLCRRGIDTFLNLVGIFVLQIGGIRY